MKTCVTDLKCILLVACIVMLLGFPVDGYRVHVSEVPAYNQSEHHWKSVSNQTYGSIHASINELDFNLLPKSEISLQENINCAKDGDILWINSSYHPVHQTLHVNKNLTLVGSGKVVIDAEKCFKALSIDNPRLDVKIENIIFVNGLGRDGGCNLCSC